MATGVRIKMEAVEIELKRQHDPAVAGKVFDAKSGVFFYFSFLDLGMRHGACQAFPRAEDQIARHGCLH